MSRIMNIPIVIFGGDYLIKEGKWLINPTAGVKNYKNKDEILKNDIGYYYLEGEKD